MQINFSILRHEDLPFFIEVRNSVRLNLHDPREFSLEEAVEWFSRTEVKYWVISLESTKVGYFRLSKLSDLSWQIGADIHPIYQGKGIASVAYPLFIDEIVRVIDPQPIFLNLRVLVNNSKAFSLYKKLGFEVVDQTPTDISMRLEL